jgi:tetratricopeptide (TPR) repeat protein
MANCLRLLGDFAGALDRYETVFSEFPELIERAPARRHYANALREYRRTPGDHFDAAIERFRRALVLKPDWRSTETDFVWALATDPRANRAHAQAALSITEHESVPFFFSSNPTVRRLDARGAALAAAGRFEEAIAIAERARALAQQGGKKEQNRALEERIARYRGRERYIEPLSPRPG